MLLRVLATDLKVLLKLLLLTAGDEFKVVVKGRKMSKYALHVKDLLKPYGFTNKE